MTSELVLNIALILVFICVGGVFAGAEMALVSLRDSQVKQLAHRGSRGRTVARLNENPNRFLSAVQIGVTLAGFLSAAFGGATSMSVSGLLSFASGQSNSGGTTWYGNVKATQELAKDTFDAINNEKAFSP